MLPYLWERVNYLEESKQPARKSDHLVAFVRLPLSDVRYHLIPSRVLALPQLVQIARVSAWAYCQQCRLHTSTCARGPSSMRTAGPSARYRPSGEASFSSNTLSRKPESGIGASQ